MSDHRKTARDWWEGGLTPDHEQTDDYDENIIRQVEALLTTATAEIKELCARLAQEIGEQMHDRAPDPQEDMSDDTGEAIAKAIRALP